MQPLSPYHEKIGSSSVVPATGHNERAFIGNMSIGTHIKDVSAAWNCSIANDEHRKADQGRLGVVWSNSTGQLLVPCTMLQVNCRCLQSARVGMLGARYRLQ
jgi:hypothetical protein